MTHIFWLCSHYISFALSFDLQYYLDFCKEYDYFGTKYAEGRLGIDRSWTRGKEKYAPLHMYFLPALAHVFSRTPRVADVIQSATAVTWSH